MRAMNWTAALAFANTLFDGSAAHNGGDCGLAGRLGGGRVAIAERAGVAEPGALRGVRSCGPEHGGYGASGPRAIRSQACSRRSYWSSTTFADDPGDAWDVYMGDGMRRLRRQGQHQGRLAGSRRTMTGCAYRKPHPPSKCLALCRGRMSVRPIICTLRLSHLSGYQSALIGPVYPHVTRSLSASCGRSYFRIGRDECRPIVCTLRDRVPIPLQTGFCHGRLEPHNKDRAETPT